MHTGENLCRTEAMFTPCGPSFRAPFTNQSPQKHFLFEAGILPGVAATESAASRERSGRVFGQQGKLGSVNLGEHAALLVQSSVQGERDVRRVN